MGLLSKAVIICSSFCFFLICRILYRLFFHPLAAHPGPFLAKCTSWYAAYQSYTGNIHLDIARCHEIYGDVVRYRPNGLLINNTEGLQGIYAAPSKAVKSDGYLIFRKNGAISILNAINREEHAPRRRLLSHAFSTAALQNYVPLICDLARAFSDSLLGISDQSGKNGEWGPARDIGTLSSHFTFDVMSTVVFYSPQNLIAKPKGRPIIQTIDSAMFLTGIGVEQPALAHYRLLLKLLLPKKVKLADDFYEITKGLAAQRIALEQEKHVNDIFGSLLDKLGNSSLSVEELAADAMTMIVAGTDTSSVAISAFFFYTAHNHDAYTRMVAEIRSNFSSLDEIVPGLALTSCTYLRACIDESMRLAPPVSAPLWRTTTCKDVVSGIRVSAGTDLATSIYSVQRSPALFSDPNTFAPERWLPDYKTKIPSELSKKAFHPFSLGSRGCIGKNIAYMEITTLLAQMAYRADWKLADGDEGTLGAIWNGTSLDFKLKSHFTSEKEGPFIKFRTRNID